MHVVTAFVDIGRERWEHQSRPRQFYVDGIGKLRDLCRAEEFKLTVYGEPDVADVPLDYVDVIRYLGVPRFNRLEHLRCTRGASDYTTRALTWYSLLGHLKFSLIRNVQDECVAWCDAGAMSHGFLRVAERLRKITPASPFHAACGPWRHVWGGSGFEEAGIAHPGWCPAGGLMAGGKRAVSEYCALYFAKLDDLAAKGAFGLEEDIMTVTRLGDNVPVVWPD